MASKTFLVFLCIAMAKGLPLEPRSSVMISRIVEANDGSPFAVKKPSKEDDEDPSEEFTDKDPSEEAHRSSALMDKEPVEESALTRSSSTNYGKQMTIRMVVTLTSATVAYILYRLEPYLRTGRDSDDYIKIFDAMEALLRIYFE